MNDVDRDWRFERRQHQDDDDWSNGRPNQGQLTYAGVANGSDQPPNQSLLVTVEEAARLLGVGRTTMFELIGRGEVKSVRLGRRRLIARKSLESFVEELSLN
jgi:excisionase family DNA binding protein